MTAQKLQADHPVVRILQGLDQARYPGIGAVQIHGRHRYQQGQVVAVLIRGQADAFYLHLGRALVFLHLSLNFDDLALIGRADGAGIVPDLGLHHAGGVRQGAGQIGLARIGDLVEHVFQNVKPGKAVAGPQFVQFHNYLSQNRFFLFYNKIPPA